MNSPPISISSIQSMSNTLTNTQNGPTNFFCEEQEYTIGELISSSRLAISRYSQLGFRDSIIGASNHHTPFWLKRRATSSILRIWNSVLHNTPITATSLSPLSEVTFEMPQLAARITVRVGISPWESYRFTSPWSSVAECIPLWHKNPSALRGPKKN